jgi:peptidoglycan/LPS O-acetylase OafA/YrhL
MSPIDTPRNQPIPGPIARIEDLVTGAIVILVGIALLAANFGLHLPFLAWDRGWALFILIGAVSPICKAVVRYRLAGRVDSVVAQRIVTALSIVAIALMFLLDVSFARWWPAFLIIGGLYTMIPGRDRKPRRQREW